MKCAVVIPIGPGHEVLALDAHDSVEQAFRVAAGPFTSVVVITIDDTQGSLGRSAARNQGVAQAQQQGADWIFFLDADDVLAPRTFAAAGPYIRQYDAVWGAIAELASDEESGVLRSGQVTELVNFSQLLANDPWITLQIGHFVKIGIATLVPFNPDLDAGEDFDYYLRVWSRFNCIKISEPLFYNRRGMRSTGVRAATDSQWRVAVQHLISTACITHDFHNDFSCRGESFRFFVENPFDIIQRQHLEGRFFESEELDYLATRVGPGAHILDVGAYVGNHVVYYSRFMRPRKITVIEPNSGIVKLLRRNLAANHVDNADLSLLGIAADRREANYHLVCASPNNLGATRLESAIDGTVRSAPLDGLTTDQVDLIKIDVEGMELDVLQGAAGLIDRWRPIIMIEVFKPHTEEFADWIRRNGYHSVREFHCINAVNFVVEPLP